MSFKLPTSQVDSANEDTEENPQEEKIIMPKKKPQTLNQAQFPSMLFEERPTIEVNNKIRKKFLIFRVYEDPIQIRPY